jgi:catechol 2,3-dioxygenase-like lactoylglutathione lyase family enzyme
MIKGAHVTFFTPNPDAVRTFFADILKYPSVDAGGGWLIFALPPTDFGVHPVDPTDPHKNEIKAEMSFYCEDIHETVSELKERGIKFTAEIVDEGWGLTTAFAMPGGGDIVLYQPRYPKPSWVEKKPKKAAAKKPSKKAGKK